MSGLVVAPDLVLPYDLITQRVGIFGRTGSGKTYTAKRVVEEVVKARLPVVVLDPNGGWWGLRSGADGKSAGLPVVILGGEHGDVPLDPTSGAAIADVVVDHPGAYVIDLSDFASDAEQDRFATAFALRLYRAKARKRDPLLLVVDEADAFAPLQGAKGQETMIGAFRTIATRARLRGIGSMWITQRPAVLNASVRAMIELLIVLQVTGKLDREAIVAWLKGKGSAEELAAVDASLARLATGEMWATSPAWLSLFVRTKASPAETFDSSKTPEVGETRIEPEVYAAVDVSALGDRIRAMQEEARENDPELLRARIRELEAGRSVETVERVVEKIVEVPVLNGEVDHLRAVAVTLGHVGQEIVATGVAILTAVERVATPRPGVDVIPAATIAVPETVGHVGGRVASDAAASGNLPRPVPAPPARKPRTEDVPVGDGSGPRLKAGARRMLSALAWFHPTTLTRPQLAMLTDISPISGTVSDYLSALRLNGLIVERDGQVGLTDAGLVLVAGEVAGKAPTAAELVATWGRKVKAGARLMLQALVDEYPRDFTRAELADVAGISQISGTTSDYLSALRRAGLLEESSAGIRANGSLFLGGRS